MAGCLGLVTLPSVSHPSSHQRDFHLYMQIGDSLEEYLVDATSDTKLRQLMMSMSEAIRTIAFKVRGW